MITKDEKMEIIKKLFSFNDDDSAIGLCKFNEDYYKLAESRERIKKRIKKDATLTQMLKRTL